MTDPAADFASLFAAFVRRHDAAAAPAAADAARLACAAVVAGHACLDLERPPADVAVGLGRPWPSLAEWREACATAAIIGAPEARRPLVIDGRRLYLRRLWEDETALAAAILDRCPREERQPAVAGGADPAARALARGATARFLVISGGPGTGKTTLAARLIEQAVTVCGVPANRIALAAPTGRAAARLQEAVAGHLAGGALAAPPAAKTLHRLLGLGGPVGRPRRDADHLLPVDLAFIDEASMVSLPLMAALFRALPPGARVILFGDHAQLASVEPGSVLADIAGAAETAGSPLAPALVVLTENHRFPATSGIHRLACAVKEGDPAAVRDLLAGPSLADLEIRPLPPRGALEGALGPVVAAGFSPCVTAADPAVALAALGRFRVLSPLRQGPYGTVALNALIRDLLRATGALRGPADAAAGLPLLITENDYPLGLFNGDTGILGPGRDGPDTTVAWFRQNSGDLLPVPRPRLPRHEPAFATTVHKAQGSEFDEIVLLLPPGEHPVVTRELVYTALTRARKKVTIFGAASSLLTAIGRRADRQAGLEDRLRAGGPSRA